jgi:hypothetical protein
VLKPAAPAASERPRGGVLAIFALLPILYAAWVGADVLRHGFFNTDDFNNIYWATRLSLPRLLWQQFNPLSDFFRPAGMVWYGVLARAFGLNAVPYHLFEILLNLSNAALVFLVLRRADGDPGVAGFAAGTWLLPAAMLGTFWWFGTIFEPTSTAYFLLAWLVFLAWRPSWRRTIAVLALYFFAFRAKEMAITLPAVLLGYDLFLASDRKDALGRNALLHAAAFGLAAILAAGPLADSARLDAGNPYRLQVGLSVLARGALWYVAEYVSLGTGAAAAAAILVAVAVTAWLRDRRMAFALGVIAVAFLPVIFLPEHRAAFYWYLPGVGAAWWLARAAGHAAGGLASRGRIAAGSWLVGLFVLTAALSVAAQAPQRREVVGWDRQAAAFYREQVQAALRRPRPAPGTVIEVPKLPRFFARRSLETFYRVVYDRPDLTVRVTDGP